MTEDKTDKPRWRLTRERIGEGVAIVLSILIAFAIDAAWEERQELGELRAALITLEGELEQSLPMLEETAIRIQGDLGYLREVMAMPDGGADGLSEETAGGVLEAMVRPNTADNNAIAVLAALEDHRLDRLNDAKLREAAVQWRQALVELEERGAAVSRAEGEAFLMIGMQPDAARAFAAYQGGPSARSDVPPEALDELMARNEVRSLVARRIIWGAAQLNETRTQLDAAEVLLIEVRRIIETL